jgi:hypothetical protein
MLTDDDDDEEEEEEGAAEDVTGFVSSFFRRFELRVRDTSKQFNFK